MMVNKKASKWWYLVALLMFVAATFQIASDHFLLGMVLLVTGGLISAVAGIHRR